MTFFTSLEIAHLRAMVRPPAMPMSHIVGAFWRTHDRDELVEAIDALRRHPEDREAQDSVNQVLGLRQRAVPLINGRRASETLEGIDAAFVWRSTEPRVVDRNRSPWR